MEANECDTGHLDSNVLLPPRKRLLAGLKRQSSESTSQGSLENSSSILLCGYSVRLQNLVKSYKNGTYMSPEEIAEAAGSAASAAAKVAAAARAVAQEKAAIAAKATAAAKHALSLVASFSNETDGREGQLKKNKMKKHIPVQQLYNKQKMVENCGTDEELARKLHRAINSSPRILKGSPGSESNNKHKKLKVSQPEENNGFPNTIAAGNGKFASPCGGDDEEDPDSEGSYVAKGYEKASKPSKSDPIVEISGEAELDHSKEKLVKSPDGMQISGRKRGRNKQKKLLLSFCSLKDRANPKDELKQSSSDVARATPDKTTAGDIPLSSMDPHTNTLVSIEPVPTWKCQDFKVPRCIEPNKVVQS